ncbi:glycosyltransferase family 4 protein [Alsobacter metallidurans]|nr:glycosyltransferase family 1 protein [Alsobacter metallidurans]
MPAPAFFSAPDPSVSASSSTPAPMAAGRHGKVVVNMRAAAFETGGQQRMTLELMQRLPDVERVEPGHALRGARGHAWEQIVLPFRAGGRLLWSPSATGPVAYGKQVVTLHDVAFFDIPEFFAPSFVRVYQTLVPILVRRAAHVVTVSEFSRHRIISLFGLPAEKVSVIYNGVSAHFGKRPDAEVEAVRSRFGIAGRYVLLQATSDPRKNLARTLEAWSRILPSLPADMELVVFGLAGRAHVFGRLQELAAMPRVRRLGFVPDADMPALMSGAGCFLFPSLYEGFGLPIIEAMRCETAVLTSDASSTGEVAGGAALLVDPTSAESIGRGLLELVSDADLRARLVGGGLARAAHFDWDDAARSYARLFDTLA